MTQETKERKKVIKLFEGDMRAVNLLDALMQLTYERGKDLPLPTVLGVIELLKISIYNDNRED